MGKIFGIFVEISIEPMYPIVYKSALFHMIAQCWTIDTEPKMTQATDTYMHYQPSTNENNIAIYYL